MLSMWGPDIPPIGVTPRPALGMFALATLGFVGFGTFVYYNIPRAPAIKREYPYGGLVTELGGLEENKVSLLARIQFNCSILTIRSLRHERSLKRRQTKLLC